MNCFCRPPRNDLEDDEIPLEERLEFGRIKREQKSQNNTTTHPIDRRIPADTRNTDRFDRYIVLDETKNKKAIFMLLTQII